ncbi:MAG TPA: histidine kinase [Ruminiclostridium sp.]|nr:histidine kinase [Ruminiclostridium sp.]
MSLLKKLSIRSQLIINFLLIVLIIIIVFSFLYYKLSLIFVNKNKDYTMQITSTIQHNITLDYQELKGVLQNIGYDTFAQEFFLDDSYNRQVENELQILSINMTNIKKDIFDIVMIGENGKYFTVNGNYEISKVLMKEIPPDGRIYNTGFQSLAVVDNSGSVTKNYFFYGMDVYSAYDKATYRNKIGFVSMFVDLRSIFKEISKISSNTEIKYYLIDKKGNLYSPDDPLKINNNESVKNQLRKLQSNSGNQSVVEINGLKNLVMVNDIPEIEGKTVSIVPEKELLVEIVETKTAILIILFVALLFLALLFYCTLNNIVQPLNKLVLFMNRVKSGDMTDLKKNVRLEGGSEINILEYEFNSMMQELNDLTHQLFETSSRLYEVEIEKEKAELAFLRSQINPHFLYNTFEVMKGIALDEGVENLYEMTKDLALIFRYSVNGSSTVTLEEELKIVRAYVQINMIRFGNRLKVSYDIHEDTKKAEVLKMILQPLVENAVYHGLEPKRGNGRLCISSCIEQGKLTITIKDEGVGIEEEKLKTIKSCLSERGNRMLCQNSKTGSIGLCNVNNRIKLTYGDKYGIDIESEINIGTKIGITIPLKESENV